MMRVNYQGFNEEAVVNPVDSCRKIPLLKGWIELTDEKCGHLYYLHSTTGETRWERPTKQSESIRRGAVGKGTKVTTRVNKHEGKNKINKPYLQAKHTLKTDPHMKERGFYVNNLTTKERGELAVRRRSFQNPGDSQFAAKNKILEDQKKRRASFSSVATRSISSSALPVSNYYYDKSQINAKNRTSWDNAGWIGGKLQTSLGQR